MKTLATSAAVPTGASVSTGCVRVAIVLAKVAQTDLLAVITRRLSFKHISSVARAVVRVCASVCAVAIVAARIVLAVVDISARLAIASVP